MHFIEKLFWWNVFSMGENLCVYKGITLSLNWIHDFKRYYQNRFGLNFPIASRSILSATSTINNTRRRCKTFMIGQLLFLGGVISTRLCNARAEGFFRTVHFSPIWSYYRLSSTVYVYNKFVQNSLSFCVCVCKRALNHSLKLRSTVRR